jgi:predicted metal-dependent hydrolase
MAPTLTVQDLTFEVRWSAQRKTVELSVERDGSLVIRAPEGTDSSVLEGFVREKSFWLYTKLAEKEALQHPVTAKEFVSGEGFPYLGRSYRLLLVDEQAVPLKLEAGRFKMLRSEAEAGRGRDIFIRWYMEHARPWIRRRVGLLAPRVGAEPTSVEVRELGFRWGSCGKAGGLNFNWATILLPPRIVEYVVVHELVHLHEPNHTPEFWQRVERAMPDYEGRKLWLAEHGAGYVTL